MKHFPALPPLCAAPIPCDVDHGTVAVPQIHNVTSNTINGPVKLAELPSHMRRRAVADKHAVNQATCEAMPATTTYVTSVSDRIIRLQELLAILQISRTTAYDWQKRNILPHSVSLGPRAVGWKLSDIERFLSCLGKENGDA